MTPRYGWYGDDFTGATDTLATLAMAGLRAMLFLGVPRADHLERAGPLDAVGIAGAARTMDPAAMQRELDPVGQFFAVLGVQVLHYKCCSTFDSAPHVGSIGAAIATLRAHMPNPFVPIVGGQPNIGRYCAFSTLFARAGAEGAVSRLDRHPTMSVHPVTPMHEADLRRHLAAQGCGPVAGVHLPAYASAGDTEAAIEAAHEAAALLFDLVSPEQLAVIGSAIWQRAQTAPLLAVGPSSVAQALAACWSAGSEACASPALGPAHGPVFILVGSLSPVTRRQVEAATSFAHVAVDADRLVDDPAHGPLLAEQVAGHLGQGRHVLAYTASSPPADTSRAALVAAATARLLPAVLQRAPVRRVGIAGGDTSSQAVQALAPWGLSYTATLGPGVAVCTAHSDDPKLDGLELMLKGGQMGHERVLEGLITGSAG
jgi:uncharacterized protein YgbK (DUF1537 family)